MQQFKDRKEADKRLAAHLKKHAGVLHSFVALGRR